MVGRVSMKMTVGTPLDDQVSGSGQGTAFGNDRSVDRQSLFLSNRIPRLENALAGILRNIPITGRKSRKLRREQLGLPIVLVDSLVAKRGGHFQGGHVRKARQRAE